MKSLCPRLVSLYGTAITITFFVTVLSLYAEAAPAPEGIRELSTQSVNVRGWIDLALGPDVMPWDDSAGMVGRGAAHGSRQTMLYAAGLILRNHPEDLERAHRAIRAVLKLQYDAPGMAWHGTYKVNELQPDQPKPTLLERGYDENWREFISTAQIVLLEGCPSRLEPELRDELLAALRRACEGAHARRVSWRYTNIALMSAYLLAWGGHQFDAPAWSQHGADLAKEIHTEFCRNQAFQEYNSPTYSGTDLYALALWRALPVFPEMATMAREMEAGLWRDLARHYHADFRNLCGPFDRSYGMDMRKYLAKASICIALALDLPAALPDPRTVEHHGFEMGFAPLMAVLGMTMPDDAAPDFREFRSPRRFEQVIENGEHPRTAQSWLERNFMVGAEQTSGERYQSKQAHPFTLHWKMSDNEIGWMRMLRDTPMEPRIVDDTVVFAQMRKVPRNFAFEVSSPGATVQSFQETRWDLPGMPLAVETNLSSPEITMKDRRFTVRYSLDRMKSQEPCLTFRVPAAGATANPIESKGMDHITLSIDKKVLNPVREKNATGKLALTAFYSDSSKRDLLPSEAKITTRTKNASGNVDVVTIEGDKVVSKEGGVATIEAVVEQAGKRLTAKTDVVVTLFYRDYHQTLVLKLFLGMEGEPVERLSKEPLFQKPHDVLCTFEEALDVIRKTDNLTRGIPKIVYLVGWQKGGHDHGYPSWDEVNPRMKRAQDTTALDSLRWLIREARAFNTTVSLHINMVDAYKQSPLWDEYVAKDCFARDENGELLIAGIQMKGEDMYNVVYPKEWETGLAQRRIDGLIQMIPELKEGHTIHIDVFIANRDGGKPISPWHAKPENGGLTPDKYVETQRKIFHYWRDRGFDVTGEGIFWAHPPGEGFTGLQAMSWWYPGDPNYQMQIPECLMARGRTDRGGDGDFRFTSSMHGEEIWQKDKETMPGFLGMFCRTTLPWYFLSRLERERFENDVLYYSDGVVALTENGKRIIRKGDFVLREDDNLFVPALWNEKEIIAYSKPGYKDKSWQLPGDWRDVKSVDTYRITLEGCVPLKTDVPINDARLILSLEEDEAVSIVPAGAPLAGKK